MDILDITDSARAGDTDATMARELLVAIDDEIAALDKVVLRSRVSMLLAAAGEFSHIGRSGADLDQAAEALEAASAARDAVVVRAAALWRTQSNTAREVVEAIPAQFAEDFRRRIDVQRSLLAEVTEAVQVAGDLSERSLGVLTDRRSKLEQLGNPTLTYGSSRVTPPPVVVAERL